MPMNSNGNKIGPITITKKAQGPLLVTELTIKVTENGQLTVTEGPINDNANAD